MPTVTNGIIPASPDYFVLTIVPDGIGHPKVNMSPVLAWLVEDGEAEPVTMFGHDSGFAVLLPSGIVADPFEWWSDVSSWFADAIVKLGRFERSDSREYRAVLVRDGVTRIEILLCE
jgi:hypothetical protein